MKRFSLYIFLVLTSFAFFACGQKGVKKMDGKTLSDLNAKSKDKILIIDVRPVEQYKAGHIPHAINLLSDTIEENLSKIEAWKNKPVITYCNTGKRSQVAADILVKNGFTDVSNADGVKQYDYNLVTYSDILATDLLEMIKDPNVILVDYRPAEQFAAGHIQGAKNIVWDAPDSDLTTLDKSKKIVLYCNTGTKSAEGAKRFQDFGYDTYNSIQGVKEYSFDLVK